MTYASSATQISTGHKALAAYHNKMIEWYDSGWFSSNKYNLSYEQLEKIVSGKNENFLAQLGDSVITAKIGLRRLDEAMERVVDKTPTSPLMIPGIMEFQKGITDEISEFDFSILGDTALDIAQQVSKNSVELVESVGSSLKSGVEGVGSTIGTIGKLLPIIVVSVVGIVLFAGYKVAKNTKKVSDLKPI